MPHLTVSKLAARAGTSADTIRYYDRIGLLPPTDRSPAGYRLYRDEVLEDLGFITRAQRLGLRLAEIGELLQVRRQGLCPCGHARGLLEAKAAELDRELEVLQQLRAEIGRMLERPGADAGSWACSGALLQIGSGPPDDSPHNQGDRP
jgi:DNA-binding transcriptional MerR regulator